MSRNKPFLILIIVLGYLLLPTGAAARSYQAATGTARFATVTVGNASSTACLGQGTWLFSPDAVTWSTQPSSWHSTTVSSILATRNPAVSYSYTTQSSSCNRSYFSIGSDPNDYYFYPSGLYGFFLVRHYSNNSPSSTWIHRYHDQGIRSFPTAWTVTGTIDN